jgi:hypothetical protein
MSENMAKSQASGSQTHAHASGDRDYRGPYGFGRRVPRLTASQPGAQYAFGESRDSRK